MARLPTPGADAGNWGEILNEYLSQSHASDGKLKDNSVTASSLAPNSVTNTSLASNAVNATIIEDGSISESLLDSALQSKVNATAPVTSVASKTGAVTLTKSDVGLGNVDNTSDAGKPISTATQSALSSKVSFGGYDSTGIYGRRGPLATISVEDTSSIWLPNLYNDIFYNQDRDGSYTMTIDGVETGPSLSTAFIPGTEHVSIPANSSEVIINVTPAPSANLRGALLSVSCLARQAGRHGGSR